MSDRYHKGDRRPDDRGPRARDAGQQQHSRPDRERDARRDGGRSGSDARSFYGEQRPAGGGPPPSGSRPPLGGSQAGSRGGSGPPKGPGLAALGMKGPGGPAGSSLVSSLLQEAKKRQEQQQQQQQQARHSAGGSSPDPGGRGAGAAASPGMREGPAADDKKRRHSPIPFPSPKRHAGGSSSRTDSPAQPSWQERLAQEQADFARQQQQRDSDSPTPHHRHQRQQQQQQQQQRRPAGPPRSPSASDGSGEALPQQLQDDDAGAASRDAGGGGSGAAANGGLRSRWLSVDDPDERGGSPSNGDLEEGEAGAADAAAELAEEEDLNRREAADLSQGEPPDESGAASDEEGSAADGGEGQAAQKSMLEECRSVEEYERLNQISEGAYGVVFRAREKSSGRVFALKKVKLEDFKDGFPQTSIREINILLSLHHRNIVNVSEVVVGGRNNGQVFMVMEFVEHDLKDLLRRMRDRGEEFSQAQVKCLLQQLLTGLAYLHEHWVMHRDLKTANLLYGNNGVLKICDFGMARQYGDPLRTYSQNVVTLYYRAVEKLLGVRQYSTALDMWSIGCIMAELLNGKVLFRPEKGAEGEMPTIMCIVDTLGTPVEEGDPDSPRYWKGWREELPAMKSLKFKATPSRLRAKFPAVNIATGRGLSEQGFDLLQRLLAWDPAKRIGARAALQHAWFRESPLPTQPELMPSYPSKAAGEGH